MFSVGGLTRKHDAIGSVEYGVGDIRTFGTRGTGVDDHGFQHLRGGNNGFSGDVGLANHHFLSEEDLLGRDFHSQVSARHHDSVRGGEDFGVVFHALLVFDFAVDLNVSVFVSEDFSDLFDVGCFTDEGGGDVVDFVGDAPVRDIVDVFVGEGGEIDDDSGKVHVFALSDGTVVFDAADDFSFGRADAEDGEDERSIGDEDGLAGFDGGGERGVGAGQFFVASLEGIIGCEDDAFSLGEFDLFGAVGEESTTNFGSFGIQKNTNMLSLILGSLPDSVQACLVSFVVSVTKVKTSNIHTRIDK
mmetsp:Transcript_5206/g.11450  ORF Transcript_5206/g.11450 Transcript_5206/m.11450 type:complete len:302 (+) Transcript_5206:533-1438(+)